MSVSLYTTGASLIFPSSGTLPGTEALLPGLPPSSTCPLPPHPHPTPDKCEGHFEPVSPSSKTPLYSSVPAIQPGVPCGRVTCKPVRGHTSSPPPSFSRQSLSMDGSSEQVPSGPGPLISPTTRSPPPASFPACNPCQALGDMLCLGTGLAGQKQEGPSPAKDEGLDHSLSFIC